MSLARVTAFALDGVDCRRVWVEADIRIGLPAFTIVGLADKAVREARERVRSAITNSGFEFPQKRITINLAPAYLRKIGPGFDLPLAMAILAASGQVERRAGREDCAFAGELSLTGELRPIRGALAVAQGARGARARRGSMVPASRAREAALVEGVEVIARRLAARGGRHPRRARARSRRCPRLAAEAGRRRGRRAARPGRRPRPRRAAARDRRRRGRRPQPLPPRPAGHGQDDARAAGAVDPAAAQPRAEAIEVTRIHSIAGLHSGGGLVAARPFRAPHHTISPSGLVGGGAAAGCPAR